jgi:hypothetical protein
MKGGEEDQDEQALDQHNSMKCPKNAKNKIKQIESNNRTIVLIKTKITNGGINRISLKFGIRMTVW